MKTITPTPVFNSFTFNRPTEFNLRVSVEIFSEEFTGFVEVSFNQNRGGYFYVVSEMTTIPCLDKEFPAEDFKKVVLYAEVWAAQHLKGLGLKIA
jgi:hypothetical protein